MVKLQSIGIFNVSFKSGTLNKNSTIKPVFARFEDRFEPSAKISVSSKSSLIGKFFGAMTGYFAASKVNNVLNNKLKDTLKFTNQKAIKYLKIGIVILNALISILTIYGASQTAGKLEGFIRNAFTDNS